MVCCTCKEDKVPEEFPWKSIAKGKRHTKCLECHRAYKKVWYENNREKHIAGVQVSKKARQAKARAFVREYLECHPCPCGEDDIIYLDFHHRDREDKDTEISKMIGSSTVASIEKIAVEIAKCDVLCVKCHRKEHVPAWRL